MSRSLRVGKVVKGTNEHETMGNVAESVGQAERKVERGLWSAFTSFDTLSSPNT